MTPVAESSSSLANSSLRTNVANQRSRVLQGTLFVLFAAASFGFMPLFNSWSSSVGVKTEMIQFLRFGIAGIVLTCVMLVQRRRWPVGPLLPVLIFMGAGLYVLESLAYFHGLRFAASGLIVLLLYTCPAMVAVMARVLFGTHLRPAKLAAVITAVIGVGLSAGPLGLENWRGLALGLGCACSYASYIIISSRVIPRVGAIEAATVVVLSAATVYGLLAWRLHEHLPETVMGWTGASCLALLSTILAITAFLAGVQRIGPVSAATLSTIEPLVAVIVSQWVLKESPMSVLQYLGGSLIIIAAVACAHLDRTRKSAS
ncbi:MAG TPA: DMT family transporter [Phycisphaerales bacterium]|nr:DMT family transporter [Phycisphaerales bacterium]